MSRWHACSEVVDAVVDAEGNVRVKLTVGCSVAEVCNSLYPIPPLFLQDPTLQYFLGPVV